MPFAVRTPEAVVSEIRAAIAEGLSEGEITRKFNIHRMTLRCLVERGDLSASPQPSKRGPQRGYSHTAVFPRWIDRDYRPIFYDNKKLYGEFTACRIARADMAEARRVEA